MGKLREARCAEDEKIIAIVGELSEEDFTRPIAFQTMASTPRKMTGNEILMSVFNHQTHHRGQVTAMLAQAGADYGDIDIPFFLEVF
ncbi:MAG: DinB family protein, partial [Rhodospirillales bacterium]